MTESMEPRAESAGSPPPGAAGGFRVHPLDLLVLLMAVALAALSYAFFFQRSPVPRPVDPFLGAVIEVEFTADRAWKETFPFPGNDVQIQEFLSAEVTERRVVQPGPPSRVLLRLHVLDRERQAPEAITLFREVMRKGSLIQIAAHNSVIHAEVVSVELTPERR